MEFRVEFEIELPGGSLQKEVAGGANGGPAR
jgi:hypothetical protein